MAQEKVKVKWLYCGEYRRFDIPMNAPYLNLYRKIRAHTPDSHDKLYWQDEEGDMIRISNEPDLLYAIENGVDKKVLRLYTIPDASGTTVSKEVPEQAAAVPTVQMNIAAEPIVDSTGDDALQNPISVFDAAAFQLEEKLPTAEASLEDRHLDFMDELARTSRGTKHSKLSCFPPNTVAHFLLCNGTSSSRQPNTPVDTDDCNDAELVDDDARKCSSLTLKHLKKSKLMFYFVRYPSPAMFKVYFPDVKLGKKNIPQMRKWFSNFREFLLTQAERYARSYLAEGIKNEENLIVTPDAEICEVLNQHFNREGHIQPPENWIEMVQEMLRKCFVVLRDGGDSDPLWKRPIFKVMTHLDGVVPEYFKDPSIMQLWGS